MRLFVTTQSVVHPPLGCDHHADNTGQPLRAASDVYLAEHRLLWEAWGQDGVFDGDPAKWADPGHRRRMAEALTEARDLEARAMAEVEAGVGKEA